MTDERCQLKHSLWKHEASINEDVSIPHTHKHAVHANLAESTNGKDSERGAFIWGWSRKFVPPVGGYCCAQMLCAIALLVRPGASPLTT